MPEPLDILDERDPLGFPFVGSVLVHASVVALLFTGWYWMNTVRQSLGELHPGGGPAYAVSPVNSIPIPRREATPNPVANDTQSTVPVAPAKQTVEKKQPPPEPNAVEIADKLKRESERLAHQQQYTQPARPNQVYSRSTPALSNPMYGGPAGAGQVGIGPNSLLGNRLGWYAELVRQRIAQNWHTNALDSRSEKNPALVAFVIMRDGTIRNPQVIQSSGNPSIDNTALRAVYDSNPLPALPPQIAESYIPAQFTFTLH